MRHFQNLVNASTGVSLPALSAGRAEVTVANKNTIPIGTKRTVEDSSPFKVKFYLPYPSALDTYSLPPRTKRSKAWQLGCLGEDLKGLA